MVLLFVLHIATALSRTGKHKSCEPLLKSFAYNNHNGMFEMFISIETLKYHAEMK